MTVMKDTSRKAAASAAQRPGTGTDTVHAEITKDIADRREQERKSAENEQDLSDSSTEPRKPDHTQASDQNPTI